MRRRAQQPPRHRGWSYRSENAGEIGSLAPHVMPLATYVRTHDLGIELRMELHAHCM
jgi:hypothetical protein